jgi:HK97 family phage portal protein
VRNPFRALFERRSAIGSSYELAAYLLGGLTSASGQKVSETTALNVAAVYTGVAIRSRLLASLPVDVIEKVDSRTSREAVTHPLRRVLLKPNTWQTHFELFSMLQAHVLLRGNGPAWINRVTVPSPDSIEREQVAELIPLHPDQLEVEDKPDDFGGPTTYKLHKRNGQIIPLPSREVLHLKGLSTDGRRGRSFLQDMREVIGGALALQEHKNSLWSRDATPSIALKHPKSLSDKARKGLEESWEATYGRGKEKRRVAVIEEGMEIQQLSLSPEDGQFLQTDQDLRAQLAAALMVPPHLMGLAEKATSWGSGIAEQNVGLLTITLGPDIRAWEERLAFDLISRPDKYQIKFNVRAFYRGDMAKQIESLVKGIQGGIYSPNDARNWLDLNPIPGDAGDVYLQPVNYAPLGFTPVPKTTGAEGNA